MLVWKRDPSRPLLLPLTPLVVAAFAGARSSALTPPAVLHAVRGAMAAVFAVGTYLMRFRAKPERAAMVEALMGSPGDPALLLTVDLVAHWLPAALLCADLLTEPARVRLPAGQLELVGLASAALTVLYLGCVDSQFLYQVTDRRALVGGFMAVYVPYVLSAATC